MAVKGILIFSNCFFSQIRLDFFRQNEVVVGFLKNSKYVTRILKIFKSSIQLTRPRRPLSRNQAWPRARQPLYRGCFKNSLQGRRNWGPPSQILADQLTLFQPGGRLCAPHAYLPPKFSDLLPGLFRLQLLGKFSRSIYFFSLQQCARWRSIQLTMGPNSLTSRV